MTNTPDDRNKFTATFFPLFLAEREKLKQSGNLFSYYTSADVALNIIKDKKIWMRNASAMNDYSEIDYGLHCLNAAIESNAGKALFSIIDSTFSSLSAEVEALFSKWKWSIRQQTYITCVSRHFPHENDNGRLSMWRAYGGKTGVALVINTAFLENENTTLGAFTSPVSYLSKNDVEGKLSELAENLKNNVHEVKKLSREQMSHTLFNIFRYAALCTKHPGFSEEQEWRVIASPSLQPSSVLESTTEVIRGTPQKVLKIPLINRPDEGLNNIDLNSLINRVIVGPCEHPFLIAEALQDAMTTAGVLSPEKRISISQIPLRHQN